MKNIFKAVLATLIVILGLSCSELITHAAESSYNETTGKYTFSFDHSYQSYKPNQDDPYNYDDAKYLIESDVPFKVVAFRYQQTYDNGGYADKVPFFIIPMENTNSDTSVCVYAIRGNTSSITHKLGYKMIDDTKMYVYAEYGIINLYYRTSADWETIGQTTIPYMNVSSYEEMNEILKDMVNGENSYKEDENVPIESTYNENIETPVLVFTEGKKFYINNAVDEYNIEIQGRWWTVDDIEIYKDMLVWKYKYSTLIKNELTDWITPKMDIPSRGEHDLITYAQKSFDSLLSAYPVENRNFYGGTNAVGNYFSGYSDAKSTIEMLLNTAGTLYTSPEIYVRFYYTDDNGVIHYGRWCHWYENLAQPEGSSGSRLDDYENMDTEHQSDKGLTDDEMKELESSGNSRIDLDTTQSTNDTSIDSMEEGLTFFKGFLSSTLSALGEVPSFFSSVFGFLPKAVINSIGVLLIVCVILRFLGR